MPERRLGIARRIDHGCHVPAVGQDELARSTEHLSRPVAGLPRGDVVGHGADDEGIDRDVGQIDRDTHRGHGTRLDQTVARRQIDEVRVQSRWHPRAVGVPVEEVEGWRRLPEQVVGDPVVPDQVVGPQPGEHLGQRRTVEVPATSAPLLGHVSETRVHQRTGRTRDLLVEERDG